MNTQTKNFILFILLSVAGAFLGSWAFENLEEPILWALPLLFFVMIIFNFIVRKNPKFERYFTSKLNIFNAKFTRSLRSDIPKDLMYHKIIEVLESTPLKIGYTDNLNHSILVTSGISVWSWGENIYIKFQEKDGATTMQFKAVTLFGFWSWGRNQDHLENLLKKFEESLII